MSSVKVNGKGVYWIPKLVKCPNKTDSIIIYAIFQVEKLSPPLSLKPNLKSKKPTKII